MDLFYWGEVSRDYRNSAQYEFPLIAIGNCNGRISEGIMPLKNRSHSYGRHLHSGARGSASSSSGTSFNNPSWNSELAD